MKLTSIAWNAAGLLAPLGVAVLSVPPLLALLGSERFGLLSLAWALTAVSGLFDLGLGRATTRLVADQLGQGSLQAPRGTLAAALRLAWLTGCSGGLLVALAAGLQATALLRISPALADEARLSLLLLALAVPLQTLIATYRGASEACQQFRAVSLVRMALGAANFAAPLWVARLGGQLPTLVLALVLARLLALLLYRRLALAALPPGPGQPLPAAARRALVQSGGWFTVSAVISPLLVQADRFFIGAMVSATAVTAYTLPFDMITQLLVGVTAVSTVALPSITVELRRNPALARRLLRRWLARVAVAMAALCAAVAALLPQALAAWLGNALPAESETIGRWLCLGVWINSLGAMFFVWLHAQGRFRATALLHALELPLYLLLLLLLLRQWGAVGAAMAWTARVTLDTAGLAWLSRRRPAGRPAVDRKV